VLVPSGNASRVPDSPPVMVDLLFSLALAS
jgi:hypothetical protein